MTRSTLIAILSVSTLFGACCPEISVSPNDTDIDTGSEDVVTSQGILEGSMSLTGLQDGEAGDTFEMAEWSFELSELGDNTGRSVQIVPTGFDFHVESDGDGRFGTPTDTEVAGDYISHCWFTIDGVGIGGPETNSMSGTYRSFEVTQGAGTLTYISLMCDTHEDVPADVEIAVSMRYTVTGDSDIYDASTARTDNAGVYPDYRVRIGNQPENDTECSYDYQSVTDSSWQQLCAIPRPTLNYGWPTEITSLQDVGEIVDLYIPIEGSGQVEIHGITVDIHHAGDTAWFDNLYGEVMEINPVVNGVSMGNLPETPTAHFPGANESAGTLQWNWSSFTMGDGSMPSSIVDASDRLKYYLTWGWHDLVPLESGSMITVNIRWTSPDAPGHIFHTRTNGVYWYVTE